MKLPRIDASAAFGTKWSKALAIVLVFGLGILVGLLIHGSAKSAAVTVTSVRDSIAGYSLINPVLYLEVSESLSFPKYQKLKDALAAAANDAKAGGKADDISFYFRDLNANSWVGVNPTEQFNPASMLKVITFIALLRASETNPAVMTDKISVPANVDIPSTGIQDYFPPADPVKSGETYAIPDLMNRLITQSDNGANALLIKFLGDPAMAQVFSDLHIPLPGTSAGVSAQDYSHLFRVLYNATYLNSEDSEKALQLLTKTNFTAGLAAGIPAGTLAAHKFGESMSAPISDPKAPAGPGLSDCGIIYYPGHPYFLCVMTQGKDFPTLATVIQNMSAVAWQQVSTLYPKQ